MERYAIHISLLHLTSLHSLRRHVRQQSHEPRALDRDSELALILGSDAGALARQDAAVRVEELTEDFRVLVIDVLDIILAEIALFVHGDLIGLIFPSFLLTSSYLRKVCRLD